MAPAPPGVRRIGGDLLDRIEQAACQELARILTAAAASDLSRQAVPLDPVESFIAWDLAAGF
jgi:hypothetical protein